MRGLSSVGRVLCRSVRRFALARRGAAAVEFALVAIPFLMLTFGIIEIGLIYFVSISLENATYAAARQIRTGQLQSGGGSTATAFTTLVCNNMSWMGASCTSNLSVSVQTFSSFQSVSGSNPVQNGQVNKNNLPFQMGGPGDIVLVQTFYQWTVIAPALDHIGTPLTGGKTLLQATAVFRNEPYA
ncbi:MAG TPA: TadE/TadG family type IV pilus assembly protein [Caulobacteraceae bacterium]|nr:TadE/TadG family type IV pilus assembly protein [Caulobacteraceae bacterium]